MSRAPDRRDLAELLGELGVVDAQVLSGAVGEQRATGRRLMSLLAEEPGYDEVRATKAMAQRLGLEVVGLDSVRIHPRVLERIPDEAAQRLGVLPYAVKRKGEVEVLYLVVSDPLDAEALEEAQTLSGCEVRVMLAPPRLLERAIARQYRPPAVRGRRGRRRPTSASEGAPEVPRPSEEVEVVRGRAASTRPAAPEPRTDPSAPVLEEAWTVDVDEAEVERSGPPTPSSVTITEPPQVEPAEPPPDVPTASGPDQAFEIPVDFEENEHPFAGLDTAPRVGLGATGIIPEVPDREEPFEPPMEDPPQDPAERRRLVGSGDIPLTASQVQARNLVVVTADIETLEEIEEIELEPVEETPSPELEILELRSAEPEVVPLDAGDDASTLEPTSGSSATASEGTVAGERPLSARELVARFEAGQTLGDDERDRLVLAVGRVLLRMGVLPREALVRELGS